MDIDLLSKMVKELILDNDRVVLPGLGAFVAEIVPSTFSDKGYTINPPYRRLYFRARPDEGNELVDFYASANDVAVEVADKILREFLSELKTVLHMRKTVVLPGLGRLRATKENAIFFVADEELDIYPEGFGLEPLSLKTHQETQEEVASVVAELKSIVVSPVEPDKDTIQEPVEISVSVPEDVVTPEPEQESTAVSDNVEAETAMEQEDGPQETEVAEDVVVVETDLPVEQEKEEIGTVDKEITERKEDKMGWKKAGKVILWLVIASILALFVFTAVARMCPRIFDSLLYTPEELEIIGKK